MKGPDEPHEWTDLLVEITGSVEGGLSLRLGTPYGGLVVAEPDEFALPVAEITDLAAALQPTIKRSTRPEVADPAWTAGARLFEAVFGGPRARFYQRVRETARQSGAGLCVRLRLDGPELEELPWELLYDSIGPRSDFLALDPEVCVVRSAFDPAPTPAWPVPPPLRVAVVGGTPQWAHFEIAHLSILGEAASVLIVDGASEDADIWHVSGTETSIPSGPPSVLVDLRDHLVNRRRQITDGTPAVLAVPVTMPEPARTMFVDAFYRALFASAPIQDAISAGRREADFAQPGSRHWASVICHLTGGGPVLSPSGADVDDDETEADEQPDADYAGLRAMIAQTNLTTLREQSTRLGAAAPETLARQIAELEARPPEDPPA